MSDADNLAMLGRVMGGLVVVLVLIGLAARVARRTRGKQGATGLRVVDRIGLSREANLTVIEVANRVLLLGVTAQGVTMLADLDGATGLDAMAGRDDAEDGERDRTGVTGVRSDVRNDALTGVRDEVREDDEIHQHSRHAVRAASAQTLAGPDRDRPAEPGPMTDDAQRRPIPISVALDEYPDLASALRAAGRTAGSTGSTGVSTSEGSAVTPFRIADGFATEAIVPAGPRTRAEARAAARAEQARAEPAQPTTAAAVNRIPLPRNNKQENKRRKRAARPTVQASGSVLSPQTWKQGIEALRDLTVRRG